MTEVTSGNLVIAQITTSAVIAYGIEWLKKAKWMPWVAQHTTLLNRALSIILSGAAALGIHTEFSSETHTLTITGLCLMCVLHSGWDWLKSWITTQIIYDGVIATKPNSALLQVGAPK